jgi:hypothetical protein
MHVREPARVRRALAAQVEAGADVIVAPAWLTHRRALMEIGESRRAAEWTKAAVRIAREAVEEGRAGRGEASEDDAVRVAGPLPDLDTRPESGSGRLAERGAAADRDREAQAGILADAGTDVILVEKHTGVEAAGRSVAAAASTGLEVWATVEGAAGVHGAGDGPDRAMEALTLAGASTVLIEVPAGSGGPPAAFDVEVERLAGLEGRPVGVLLPRALPDLPPERLRRWLQTGASVLGIAEGAVAEALKPLREAIDAERNARDADREASEMPWRTWVLDGAARAPAGAALWFGDAAEPPDWLPDGFAWTFAGTDDLGRLPAGGYRLVVAGAGEDVELRDLVRILDDGGVALARLAADALPRLDGAQVIDIEPDGPLSMVALRRIR